MSKIDTNLFDAKAAVKFIIATDPILGEIIKKVGPFPVTPDKSQGPYHALIRSIVYQQLTGKAAGTIFKRVKDLFPHRSKFDPEEILKTPDKVFRSAGLSGAKTAAIKDLSAKHLEGIVPTRREINKMTNEEIIERLVQVRGIGPWTVEMLLIFHIGRMDVLPSTDYGVRKGFALVYNKRKLPEPKELLKYGERWRPYRSVASWYLWRALELTDNT